MIAQQQDNNYSSILAKKKERVQRLRRRKELLNKWFLTLGSTGVAFIPTYIFVGLKNALAPDGFWQNFVVYGVGLWFLGSIQLLLVLCLAAFIFFVWTEM